VLSPSPGPQAGTLRLLSTDGFITDLHHALATCEDRILIQVMTFDGDPSGQRVGDLLLEAVRRGAEVRVLIDCFATRYISDRPVIDPEIRAEVVATDALYRRLRSGGVELRFTNPNGPLNLFAAARNHKKLYVIDDLAYLGGVNISDHNFSWLDIMVRIGQPDVVAAIVDDFDAGWRGQRRSLTGTILTNTGLAETFEDLVTTARREIVIGSSYAIDLGFVRLLERARAERRTVITAADNNLRICRLLGPYLHRRLRLAGVELEAPPRFSHAKFLLVDGEVLLVGSSNLGSHSFACNQEIGLVITDREVIQQLRSTLLSDTAPLSENRSPVAIGVSAVVAHAAHLALSLYAATIADRVPPLDQR
jgi:cardiolipin synthase